MAEEKVEGEERSHRLPNPVVGKAQGAEGDLWRRRLIRPVVLKMAHEVAIPGGDPFGFSAFESLRLGCERPIKSITPAKIIDLGCGDAWLANSVEDAGGSYVGVESVVELFKAAKARGRGKILNLDIAAPGEEGRETIRNLLASVPTTLVTIILVLETIEKPEELLCLLAGHLQDFNRDIPVLVVTLDSDYFLRDRRAILRTSARGSREFFTGVHVESTGETVNRWVRTNHRWEEIFRDSGFLVRQAEPLYFGPNICERAQCLECTDLLEGFALPAGTSRPGKAPSGGQLESLFRVPTFWSWRLSARRTRCDPIHHSVLSNYAASLQPSERPLVRCFEIDPGQPLVVAGHLGGELIEIVSGTAHLNEIDGYAEDAGRGQPPKAANWITFPEGTILGDLEATAVGGPHWYSHAVYAGAAPTSASPRSKAKPQEPKCRIVVLHPGVVERELERQRDLFSTLYRATVDRLQLDIFRQDCGHVQGNWLADVHPLLKSSRPQYLWRLARGLLWAATIERRARTRSFLHDVVLIDMPRLSGIFHPSAENHDELRKALRVLQMLRIIDGVPFKGIAHDTRQPAGLGKSMPTSEFAQRAWSFVCRSAARKFLGEAFVPAPREVPISAQIEHWLRAASGSAKEEFRGYLDAAKRVWAPVSGSRAPNAPDLMMFIVLRDLPALRRLAFGASSGMQRLLDQRARYLLPKSEKNKNWDWLTPKSEPASLKTLVALAARFSVADLEHSRRLSSSHELVAHDRRRGGLN